MTKPDPLLRLLIHAYLFGLVSPLYALVSLFSLDAIISLDPLDYSVSSNLYYVVRF